VAILDFLCKAPPNLGRESRGNVAFQEDEFEEVGWREKPQQHAISNNGAFAGLLSQQNAQSIRSIDTEIQHAVSGRIG